MISRPYQVWVPSRSFVMEPARFKSGLDLPIVLALLCGLAFKMGRQGTRRSRPHGGQVAIVSQPPWARQRPEETLNTTMQLSGHVL